MNTVTAIQAPERAELQINREHDSSIDVGLERVFENLESPLEVTAKSGGSEIVDLASMLQRVRHANCATADERQLNSWAVNWIKLDFHFPTSAEKIFAFEDKRYCSRGDEN